ncbi:hypothetical protein BS78_04G199700 [Paspalum vaginatum]|nr:hypothetical protein BS78_04G199700 [Paspalum vaginatum]
MGAHAPGTERLLDSGDSCERAFWTILPGALGALLALLILVPMLYWPYQYSFDNGKRPEYTVAVAAFSGLGDPARATVDPTFDLTVRITEPRRWSAACVERGTTAVVSYRGARLAAGPVPGFCGQNENVTEVGSVMAWGTAVPLPRFARDSLADEIGRGVAAVDVKLVGPVSCQNCGRWVFECDKAPLGRGEPSPPCSLGYEYQALPDDSARTVQRARKELRTTQ